MIRKITESKPEVTEQSVIRYSQDEICPICGTYSVDGSVCPNCLKAYDLYEPKIDHSED